MSNLSDIISIYFGSGTSESVLDVIRNAVERDAWSTGPAPGMTWVLIKCTNGHCHEARLESNPCVWVDRYDHIIMSPVTAWRHL